MNDTFDLASLRRELIIDEGYSLKIYRDTMGKTSVGIGRNLSDVGLRRDEVELLFVNDIDAVCETLDKELLWWRTLPQPQQRVMINLCFNMGWAKLAQFTHFLAAMQAGDWKDAALELQHSLWYQEVASRGPRMVARLCPTQSLSM